MCHQICNCCVNEEAHIIVYADLSLRYVTLHHEMSRNVPVGHFHVFIFSDSKFYALYNGENHFQTRELVARLHVFE